MHSCTNVLIVENRAGKRSRKQRQPQGEKASRSSRGDSSKAREQGSRKQQSWQTIQEREGVNDNTNDVHGREIRGAGQRG